MCMCMGAWVCRWACVCLCVHACVCVHACACACACLWAWAWAGRVRVHTNTHARVYVLIRIFKTTIRPIHKANICVWVWVGFKIHLRTHTLKFEHYCRLARRMMKKEKLYKCTLTHIYV